MRSDAIRRECGDRPCAGNAERINAKNMAGRLKELLGVDDPIVLGPFGGVSSVRLAANVSECGGLGS